MENETNEMKAVGNVHANGESQEGALENEHNPDDFQSPPNTRPRTLLAKNIPVKAEGNVHANGESQEGALENEHDPDDWQSPPNARPRPLVAKNTPQWHDHDEKESEEESLRKEIEKYKETHASLCEDTAKLQMKKEEAEYMARKFQDRAEKEERKLAESEEYLRDQDQQYQDKVRSTQENNHRLKAEQQRLKESIARLEEQRKKLEEVSSFGVERKMVFKGKVSDNISRSGINVKHQIKYSVKGGTALIVFEEPLVAARLIKKQHHKVAIEECYINVRAEPVELTVLDSLNMDMSRNPWKILVSNLPAKISEDQLLDKLELFFGKKKNGGGEVDSAEYLADSKSATVTFTEEGVAARLVEKNNFDVPFSRKETHQVCVSPSLDGKILRYEMKRLLCNRTVLITGIPDIKDEETLKDLLEIHFQKETNAGGEVQKLFYCPEGKTAVVWFEDDEDDVPQNE